MWMLAFVFVASAIAKFADIERATAAVRSFLGTPRLPRHAGALLAASELTLAVGLALAAGWMEDWRRLVAAVAAAVLWIFAAGLLVNWLLGNRFSCGCFGASSTVVGPTTIVRTAALAGVATWTATSVGTVLADPLFHALTAALVTGTVLGAGAMVTAVRSEPPAPIQDKLL
jgi:hypothetical protein